MVYVWYPAEADQSPSKASAPYFPEFAALAAKDHFWTGAGLRLVTRAIGSHSVAGAPLATGESRYPVVLFSPGGGNPVHFYAALLEELASHGYIAVAVEPTYDGWGQVFPGAVVTSNRVELQRPQAGSTSGGQPAAGDDYRSFYHRRVEQRVADLRFVLDRLTALNSGEIPESFRGRLDLRQVGVLGHSIGGIAAVEAAREDPRIRATINLDGAFDALPFFSDSHRPTLRQPLLWLKHVGEPPKSNSKSPLAALHPESYRVVVNECRHSDFSDEPFFYPEFRPAAVAERDQRTQAIRDCCREFLDQALCGRRSQFFAADTKHDPHVVITHFGNQ